MNREELIAPERYNVVSEMEKYTGDSERKALLWLNDQGETKEVTYQNLMNRANKIGNAFLDCGLKQGDKILVMIPRLIEAYQVYTAALKAGLVVIPSSEMLRTKDLQYRVSHGEVRAVVSYAPYTDQFQGIREYDQLVKFSVGERKEGWYDLDRLMEDYSRTMPAADTSRDDMAFLSYTSGTTGNPKGVVHTHGWGYAHLKTAAYQWLAIEDGDTVWATARSWVAEMDLESIFICAGDRGTGARISWEIRSECLFGFDGQT